MINVNGIMLIPPTYTTPPLVIRTRRYANHTVIT